MPSNTFQIDCKFPGGNAIIEQIDGQNIYFRPDLRDTPGHWFYWAFRLTNAKGQRLRFHLTEPHTLTDLGPAVSIDQGWSWRWLGPHCMKQWSFDYLIPANDIRLAMAMVYTQKQFDAFMGRLANHPNVKSSVLCHSRKNRPAEMLRIAQPDTRAPHTLLITARHHCCEMMANYVLEGIIDAVTADNTRGRWFAENLDITVIPFVDKDGVEDGDQGKNRHPHDHNRDYDGQPIYHETKAIIDYTPQWADGRPLTVLDLHCPWIRGQHNDCIYLVGSADQQIWQQQQAFAQLLEAANTGHLPYHAQNNLPFGQAWNNADNFGNGTSITRWAGQLPSSKLATSMEIPYAVADNVEVNPHSARHFGHDIAAALQNYLQND